MNSVFFFVNFVMFFHAMAQRFFAMSAKIYIKKHALERVFCCVYNQNFVLKFLKFIYLLKNILVFKPNILIFHTRFNWDFQPILFRNNRTIIIIRIISTIRMISFIKIYNQSVSYTHLDVYKRQVRRDQGGA